MTPTFEIPAAELNRLTSTLRQWASFTGKEMEQVIREEGRLLARDAINLTPPTIRGTRNQFQTIAPAAQRKAAEAQIEKDVRAKFKSLQSVLAVFEKMLAGGRAGKRGGKANYTRVLAYIRQYASEGRTRAVQTMLADFHIHAEVSSKATVDVFRELKRGRRIIVLDASSIEAVIKAVLKKKFARVGQGKSGWNRSARGLGIGGKLPRWVGGKSGAGNFTVENQPGKFAITLENSVRHIQKNPDAIVGEALRRRVRSIENRMKAMTEKATARAAARR